MDPSLIVWQCIVHHTGSSVQNKEQIKSNIDPLIYFLCMYSIITLRYSFNLISFEFIYPVQKYILHVSILADPGGGAVSARHLLTGYNSFV